MSSPLASQSCSSQTANFSFTTANSSFTSIDTDTPQACTATGKFRHGSRRLQSNAQTPAPSTPVLLEAPPPTSAILDDEEASILADKLARTAALHARWEYEDTAEEPLHGDALIARERHQCREIGFIVFGFSLRDEQVDAIRTLFFEQRDLLLLAKTGFGKSLIFQLLPFMTPCGRRAIGISFALATACSRHDWLSFARFR